MHMGRYFSLWTSELFFDLINLFNVTLLLSYQIKCECEIMIEYMYSTKIYKHFSYEYIKLQTGRRMYC